ncbi:MAG: carbon monoxide dehydrogenase [Acidimicrobiaceae bacterium]|nr:carbon monoxide dehydrogenase [Acidimicrobiaceae bacterium]
MTRRNPTLWSTPSTLCCVPIAHPQSIEQLTALLRDEPKTVLLAGGTDLMVALNHGSQRIGPDELIVSLKEVSELSIIEVDHEQRLLRIGAGVSWDELLGAPVDALAPCLTQAARTVGSHQIRTSGTIGGNIATASPAGDGVCALVALNAVAVLTSPAGQRRVAVEHVATGPKRSVLANDEFIESIEMPIIDGWQGYSKIGTRNAMVISVAGVAAVLSANSNSCRIALGSVGPTVMLAEDASSIAGDSIDWSNFEISADSLEHIGELVQQAASPIDDHRSTAAYRSHSVGVLARRLIERGVEEMRNSK